MLASSIVLVSAGSSFAQAPPISETTPPGDFARQEKEADRAAFRRWLERRVRALDGPAGDRERGVSVAFGGIVPGSGLAGGVSYRHLNAFPRGLGFQIDGRVSHRRYLEFAAAVGFLNKRSSTVELDTADRRPGSLFNDSTLKEPGSAVYVESRYRYYPQQSYYGGGLAARTEDRADYALSGISVEGVWQRQFTRAIGMSVRGGVLDVGVGSGTNPTLVNFEDRFTPVTVSGGVSQPRFLTFGAGLVRDTRQQPGSPEDGTFIGVAVRRFAARGTPDLDFTRMALDVRGYVRPITTRGVLALRGLLSSDFTDSGSPTPFYLQQYLGGGDTVRGLRSYRFQDQALFVLTAEYRWRVHRYIDIAPFVDAGSAAPALSRLSFASLRVSPGIAIRARTDRRTIVRLELASGPEGYRIMVGTGPSF
jgi:outer membrane protein assembly factor BamA